MRVPGYSPEAVAEHAMALALAVNRRLHKAYVKVRENDFSLNGLLGFNFYGKTAGIIGTGKIGAAMVRICRGFGMRVLAYDVCQNPAIAGLAEYTELAVLLRESDLVSLHCPLTDDTYHLICRDTIAQIKEGAILVNTSRGALVKTEDLIEGIRARKFFGVGLDVYEEETPNVFEDRSDQILEHSVTAPPSVVPQRDHYFPSRIFHKGSAGGHCSHNSVKQPGLGERRKESPIQLKVDSVSRAC